MAAGGIDAPWSLCVLELQWSRSVIAAEKFLGLVAGAMGYELQWSRNVKAAESAILSSGNGPITSFNGATA